MNQVAQNSASTENTTMQCLFTLQK